MGVEWKGCLKQVNFERRKLHSEFICHCVISVIDFLANDRDASYCDLHTASATDFAGVVKEIRERKFSVDTRLNLGSFLQGLSGALLG